MSDKQLTAQEIFDTVAKYLFEQGEPAHINNACVYKTKVGLMCAAGVLIQDIYNPIIESHSFQNLVELRGIFGNLQDYTANKLRPFQSKIPQYLKDAVKLISALQVVHDEQEGEFINWVSTDTMRFALDAVAHEYKLDNNILATLKFANR